MAFRQALKIMISTALIFLATPVFAVSQSQDQVYLPAANVATHLNDISYSIGQSFKPLQNRLTRVDVSLNMVAGPNPDLSLTMADASNNFIESTTNNCTSGICAFSFPSPIQVTTDQEYRFYLRDSSGNYSWDARNPGGYSRGTSFVNGHSVAGQDFLFRTWGYNVNQETESTPSVLEPPTNLVAFDVLNDQGGAVRLTWFSTVTNDYEGYNIYRREKKQVSENEAEYLLVGSADRGDTEFTDEKNLDPTKTYLYHLRTYKGDYESENSGEVEIQPTDDIAPDAPQALQVVNVGKGWVEFSWQKVNAPDLAGYVIKYGRNSTSLDKSADVGREQATFKLEKLRRGTKYYFVITAQDNSGNASPSSNQVEAYIEGLNWVWYLFIGLFILFLAGVYLYFAWRRKWWPFRRKKIARALDNSPKKDKIKGNKENNLMEASMAEAKKIGAVTHYFGKIGVGIVKLSEPLSVGDKIKIKGATSDVEQEVTSMQVNHEEIKEGKVGDEVGIKVDGKVRDGDEVFLA